LHCVGGLPEEDAVRSGGCDGIQRLRSTLPGSA
jgi:hypothetical protein